MEKARCEAVGGRIAAKDLNRQTAEIQIRCAAFGTARIGRISRAKLRKRPSCLGH